MIVRGHARLSATTVRQRVRDALVLRPVPIKRNLKGRVLLDASGAR